MTEAVEILTAEPIDPFEFRWPDALEAFEGGWLVDALISGKRHTVRHGIGSRKVYGRERVHTVTWVDGAVQVEGAEADGYPSSQALISRLRRSDRKTVRTWEEVPTGYKGFDIVEHRREIDAPYSPQCLAVKVREDDVACWALHAWLRSQLPRGVREPSAKPSTLYRRPYERMAAGLYRPMRHHGVPRPYTVLTCAISTRPGRASPGGTTCCRPTSDCPKRGRWPSRAGIS